MRGEYLPDHVLLTAARVEQRHGQTVLDDHTGPDADVVLDLTNESRVLGHVISIVQ